MWVGPSCSPGEKRFLKHVCTDTSLTLCCTRDFQALQPVFLPKILNRTCRNRVTNAVFSSPNEKVLLLHTNTDVQQINQLDWCLQGLQFDFLCVHHLFTQGRFDFRTLRVAQWGSHRSAYRVWCLRKRRILWLSNELWWVRTTRRFLQMFLMKWEALRCVQGRWKQLNHVGTTAKWKQLEIRAEKKKVEAPRGDVLMLLQLWKCAVIYSSYWIY